MSRNSSAQITLKNKVFRKEPFQSDSRDREIILSMMKELIGNNLKGIYISEENIKFSDLCTTGMILKEIENELIPQTVTNNGKLSEKVQLGQWNPWYNGTEKIEEEKNDAKR